LRTARLAKKASPGYLRHAAFYRFVQIQKQLVHRLALRCAAWYGRHFGPKAIFLGSCTTTLIFIDIPPNHVTK
jgi:hypothetical protein